MRSGSTMKPRTKPVISGLDRAMTGRAMQQMPFGLMCICYEEPARRKAFNRELKYPELGLA